MTCSFEGCKNNATYGQKQHKATYCKIHKQPDMVTKSAQYCMHDIRKYECNTCKNYCIHLCDKSTCKICNKICIHSNIEQSCKECKRIQTNKKAYCEHNHHKRNCRICSPKNFCIHDKKTSQCKDCKGCSICEHGKQKHSCKDCKGSSICEHNKQKLSCGLCNPSILCKTHLCGTITSNPLYKGYCMRCFIHLYPNETVSRRYKTKERCVVEYIIKYFPEYEWIQDKIIEDGCSKRRPDMYLDLGSHILIIEVDENQHYDYNCICDNKRTMEISKDTGHRNIIFIRFNPDGYLNSNNEYVCSPWKLSKSSGLLIIPNNMKKEWKLRLDTLKEQIKYWILHKPDKLIEIIQMYYNQSKVSYELQQIQVIDDSSKFCVDCGKGISPRAERCVGCNNKMQSKVKERPSLEQILQDLKDMGSFQAVGKHYGTSDNSVRKWLKDYDYQSHCELCKKSVKSFGKICTDCRKNRVPSLEQLEDDLKQLKTYKVIGQKYNVKDTLIHEWIKKRRNENKAK